MRQRSKSIIIILLMFVGYFIANAYSVVNDKTSEINQEVDTLTSKIAYEFGKGTDAILLLSENTVFKQYLDSKNANDKQIVTQTFYDLLKQNEPYDQVRYLDKYGKEIIRVDRTAGEARVVPNSELQDKSKRYYFIDTMRLNAREVFVSPLDLNIEGGKIEYPEKPTVRVAVPVFDTSGEKEGIVIINYNASGLINEIHVQGDSRPYLELYVLNSDGYFIHAPDSSIEWGFVHPSRNAEKFAKYFPNAAVRIVGSTNGYFINSEGIFFYNKIYPIQECQGSTRSKCTKLSYFSKRLDTREFHFVVVSHAPLENAITQIALNFLPKPILLLLLMLGAYFIVNRLLGNKR